MVGIRIKSQKKVWRKRDLLKCCNCGNPNKMFQDSTFSTVESLSLNKEQFARQISLKILITKSWRQSFFTRAVEVDFQLISKAFKNQLIIPEFPNFCGILRDIYEDCRVSFLQANLFKSNFIFLSLRKLNREMLPPTYLNLQSRFKNLISGYSRDLIYLKHYPVKFLFIKHKLTLFKTWPEDS